MARRRKRVARRKPKMMHTPEMHAHMMKHTRMSKLVTGLFLVILGASAYTTVYRWEDIAIVFGLIVIGKGLFMKKCC